ncbi:MAG: DUF6531 domain-containing protein [Gammaproteobacteria bacterium]|nr:DUF6531 domain-containing protein [Gammaproteobacteria bacterium]
MAAHKFWETLDYNYYDPSCTWRDYIVYAEALYGNTYQINWKRLTEWCPNSASHASVSITNFRCVNNTHWHDATDDDHYMVGGYCASGVNYYSAGKNAGKPDDNCPVGNPINLANGNKFQIETDHISEGVFPVELLRYYNSRAGLVEDGQFGRHWRGTYDRSITKITSDFGEFATVYREDGKSYQFVKDGGSWISDADVYAKLEETATGWKYTTTDSTVETYDNAIYSDEISTAKLLSITNLNGASILLTYDTESGKLESVNGEQGLSISFTYGANGYADAAVSNDGRRIQYEYDSDDNLIQVTYPPNDVEGSGNDQVKIYHYNEQIYTSATNFPHALTGITDERGIRYAYFEYGSDGRAISSYHAGNANKIDIEYHSDGLRSISNSRGQISTYSSILQHGVALLNDISGPGCSSCSVSNTNYDFDVDNNNLLSKTQNGITAQYGDYDDKGQYGYKIEAVGTPKERRTDYSYDPRFFNKITSIEEPSVAPGQQKLTTYTYDDWGNRLSETINGFRPDGTPVNRTTTWEYQGPLHQVSRMDGPRSNVADITTYNYYPNDPGQGANRARLQRVTDATGVAVRDQIQYTPTGKVMSESRPNGLTLAYDYYYGNDRLETLTESDGTSSRITLWTYLATGEVESITQGHGSPEATTLSFGYDDARRLTRITDGLGNYIEYQLDTEGNREAERIHDSNGYLLKQLTQTFDLYNRLDISAQANEQRSYDFAPDGTLERSTDGRGSVTDYSYDALKRLTQMVQDQGGNDPGTANATIQYGYDAGGRLASVTDPIDGNTGYVYDDLGNLLSQASPDTGVTTFTHDEAGNVLTRTDAKGQVFHYHYDALNRLTLIDGPAAFDFIHEYDHCLNGQGRLCVITGPVAVVAYRYTGYGVVAGIDQTATTWQGTQYADTSLDYAYDSVGRVSRITYPSGAEATYHYNAAGQVTGVDLDRPGSPTVTLVQVQSQYPFGPIQFGVFGNAQYRYAYLDSAYRPNWRYSGPYQQWINPYNAYDGNGNLLTFSGSEQPVFQYDALNRLEAATAATFGSREYGYDQNGNRTLLVSDGQSTSYDYASQSNRLGGVGGQAVSLDANGNTTNLRGMTLNYNANNRLISVTGLGEYRYNGLGQRVVKTRIIPGIQGVGHRRAFAYGLNGELLIETGPTGQVTREYLYLDGEPLAVLDQVPTSSEVFLVADFDGDGVITAEDFYEWYFLHYIPTPNPAYDITGDGVNNYDDFMFMVGCAFGGQDCRAGEYETRLYYVHNDHMGTPKALTDAAGNRVWHAVHDPFGMATVDEDPDGDGVKVVFNLRFPGQHYDKETGLHYNYFRYYEPSTGRYITSDPIGLSGGINTYTYALNNPLFWIDPYGLDLTVSLNPNAAAGFGHIGLGVNTPNTVGQRPQPGASSIQMGLGLNVPGQISPDPAAPSNITIPTTPEQDRNVQQCIDARTQQQQDYNLYNNNCTQFVQQCLGAAGINTPNTIFPSTLFEHLQQNFGANP